MVGEDERKCAREVLTHKQIHHILEQSIGEPYQFMSINVRPAAEGLVGFLGDHFRVVLEARVGTGIRILHLFVKSVPVVNQAKADFIDEGNFFRRESLMFKVFEDLGGDNGDNPWRPKAYLYTESILVMPDLSKEGYSHRLYYETLDLEHVMVSVASIARFHAAYTNNYLKKLSNGRQLYNFLDDYGDVMGDPTFKDSLWLKAAAKASTTLLKTFSNVYKGNYEELEEKLRKMYIDACESLCHYDNTLNVLVHKDLWVNNIMFRYKEGTPVNSILLDFQCVRYGPPAFDLTQFLYLTTTRSFREAHEKDVFLHYHSLFTSHLEDDTKSKLKDLKYDLSAFLKWCEHSRRFGLFVAIGIFPYVLMDPMSAKKYYDNPETYIKYCNEDRSDPILEYSSKCSSYKDILVEVNEEFMERYVLKLH